MWLVLKLQELIAKFVVIPILGREFGVGEESLAAPLSTGTNAMISEAPENMLCSPLDNWMLTWPYNFLLHFVFYLLVS